MDRGEASQTRERGGMKGMRQKREKVRERTKTKINKKGRRQYKLLLFLLFFDRRGTTFECTASELDGKLTTSQTTEHESLTQRLPFPTAAFPTAAFPTAAFPSC